MKLLSKKLSKDQLARLNLVLAAKLAPSVVLPPGENVPRFKDGTPKRWRDRVRLLEERFDSERFQTDARFRDSAEVQQQFRELLEARSNAEREEMQLAEQERLRENMARGLEKIRRQTEAAEARRTEERNARYAEVDKFFDGSDDDTPPNHGNSAFEDGAGA